MIVTTIAPEEILKLCQCRQTHLSGGWHHSFAKQMCIFLLLKKKKKSKIYSSWRTLENSERMSKEKLKYLLSQHQVKTTVNTLVFVDLMCVLYVAYFPFGAAFGML